MEALPVPRTCDQRQVFVSNICIASSTAFVSSCPPNTIIFVPYSAAAWLRRGFGIAPVTRGGALLHDRYFLVFGGSLRDENFNTVYRNDVLAFDLSDQWSVPCRVLSPQGQPPCPRNAATLTCAGNAAILSCGGTYPDSYYDDVYMLEFKPYFVDTAPISRAPQLDYYQTLFRERRFSDVVLVVQGHGIPAHRVILAARAPYFRSLLLGNFAEGVSETTEVTLHGASLDPFLHVLEYLYSGVVNGAVFSSQETLLGVIECAQMLGVEGLLDDCEVQLLRIVNDVQQEQLMPLLQLAETFGLNRLYWTCLRSIHYFVHFAASAAQRQCNSIADACERPLDMGLEVLDTNEAFLVLSETTKARIRKAYSEVLSLSVVATAEHEAIRLNDSDTSSSLR